MFFFLFYSQLFVIALLGWNAHCIPTKGKTTLLGMSNVTLCFHGHDYNTII